MYYSISEQEQIATLADAVVVREREVFKYDININNYESMLATMPQDNWPANIVAYQFSTLDQVPDEFDADVTTYQFRDRIRFLIRTERAERAKSYSVYQALLEQIPLADRDAAIAAAILRYNAAQTP